MWSNVVAQLSVAPAGGVERAPLRRLSDLCHGGDHGGWAVGAAALGAKRVIHSAASEKSAMVAAGMTWIIGTQARVSTRQMLFSAIVLAGAFALSALI